MDIYTNFLSVLSWFCRIIKVLCSYFLTEQNRKRSSREYIEIQNPIRRLMFLKIQHLFKQTNSNIDPNKCSLSDYRCPICFNHKQYSFRWIALGCGHILCSHCLQHLYFSTKPTCPNCRSTIILSDLTILYI